MKLLFDGSSMQGSSHTLFHGGGEYAKFILREAIARGYRFDIVFSSRLITDPAIEELLKQKPNYKTYVVADKQELYELIDTLDYDAFYSALPYIYSDYRAKARLVGVIHGLRSIELSWDDYRYQYYNSWYARLAARLINKAPCVQAYFKF